LSTNLSTSENLSTILEHYVKYLLEFHIRSNCIKEALLIFNVAPKLS